MLRISEDLLDQLINQYRQAKDAGLEVMLLEMISGENLLDENYNANLVKKSPKNFAGIAERTLLLH